MRARLLPPLLVNALLLTTPFLPSAGHARQIDPATGLVVAEGWELAAAHCGGCHSHRLVIAQRGDEEFWRSTIRWMQRTQNLWEIPADQERPLIAYLAANYDETDWGRRPALPQSLMPAPSAGTH